jgi:alpha-L-arabinofuranosidase
MRSHPLFLRRILALALVGGALTVVVPRAVGGAGPASATDTALSTTSFTSVRPIRLLDTRAGSPTVDGVSSGGGAIAAGSTVEFQVTGRGALASGAVGSVVLNLTALGVGGDGFLTVFPTGTTRPSTSNVNFRSGLPASNLVVVPVGEGGRVSVFTSSTANVIADEQGWFPTGAGFTSVAPARLTDTRTGGTTVDGSEAAGGIVAADGSVDMQVTGRGGVPTTGVGSVVLNITAIGETDGGFVTVYASGTKKPATSNVNLTADEARATLVIVPVGEGGKVTLSSSARAHVIADVQGWFNPDPNVHMVAPARVLDTRVGGVTIDGAASGIGAVGPNQVVDLQVTGRANVPATGVGSVFVDVTIIGETAPGFATVFPSGTTQPVVSNVNYSAGVPTGNLVAVPLGAGGRVSIFVSARAHVIVDVHAWMPGDPVPSDPTAPGTSPAPDPGPAPTFPLGPSLPPIAPGTRPPVVTVPPVPAPNPTPNGPADGTITVNAGQLRPFSSRMVGTNAASYEGSWTYEDPIILARMNGLAGSLRWPGGQHSQSYGWANCMMGGAVAGAIGCLPGFDKFGNAGDLAKLLRNTGTSDAVIGMNMNATAKENAALVAFFNGTVGDTRPIGVDQKGADWKTVGYWAQLRTDSGSPSPLNLTIFEFGNETYGGGKEGGKGCLPGGGWETTYTCDPAEYLDGLGSGAGRFDGFVATRALMKSLFPAVQVGAPIADTIHDKSANPCCGWNDTYVPYAQNLLRLGSGVIDFLNVHEYLINRPTNDVEMSALPQAHWSALTGRINALMDQFAGRRIPLYQSEYALYPVVSNDANDKRSNWVLNGLVMADSLGTLDALGYVGANQFNMFSSAQGNNIYYGLLRNDGSYTRTPTYWATLLWSRFGNQVAATSSTFDNKSTLSVYGGKTADGQISLYVINKSTSTQTANLQFQGVAGVNRVVTDAATSAGLHEWSMTFNGNDNPANDLSNAPSTTRSFASTSSVVSSFPPGSMTLLRFTPSA